MGLRPSPAVPAAGGANLLSLGSPLLKPPGLFLRAGPTTPALLLALIHRSAQKGVLGGSSLGPVQMGHNNPERAGYTEEMAILEELRRETDQAIELYRTEVGFER